MNKFVCYGSRVLLYSTLSKMKKILVIDDDISILKSLKDLLSLSEYEVRTTSNSIEAVKLAGSLKPDLILCDILMPNLDGLGVLHELSKNTVTANIPFIFLTAKSELQDIRKGMELGADDYLIKPFTPSDLLRAIDVRLSKREKILSEHNKKLIEEPNKRRLDKENFIILMSSERPENVKISNIVYIEAMEKYSNVYMADRKKITVRKLIKDWELVLPEEIFVRIHRSIIINLEYVQRLEKWFNYSFRIYLKNVDKPLEASRRYASLLKSKIQF